MKKKIALLVLSFSLIVPLPLTAGSGAWRFALGYRFLNNVKEIKYTYKHLLGEKTGDKDIYISNFGLSFQPYYQFKNGLRAGAGAGPLILMVGDARHIQLPLNLTIGHSFFTDSAFSLYVRGGIAFHIATGDFYVDSFPGFYGGIGCKILITKPVNLGFETAYDGARIELGRFHGIANHKKITTGKLTFYLYADF